MLFSLLMIPLLWASPPGEVRQPIGGAQMNWTTLMLETSSAFAGSGVDVRQSTIEHGARDGLSAGIQGGLLPLQITRDLTLSQLFNQGKLGETLRERSKLWSVSESRYYSSGRVEVLAEVSLFEILKPWMRGGAQRQPEGMLNAEFTGLVIDNRQNYTSFCFAPRVLAADGEVLFDGRVWRGQVTHIAPTVFVSDLAHPAALRVGERPLIVRPARMRGTDYLLSVADSVALRAAFHERSTLGEGTVVVLVKP